MMCSGLSWSSLTPMTIVASSSPFAGARGGALRARLEVERALLALAEDARRLEDDVRPEVLPRDLVGLLLAHQRDRLPPTSSFSPSTFTSPG